MSSSAADAAATPPPVVHAGQSQGSQLNVFLEQTKTGSRGDIKEGAQYGHKKSLSDATMLVHSSGEDEELEEDGGRHTPLSQEAASGIVPDQPPQQHRSVNSLSSLTTQQQIPKEPPPAYPIGSALDPSITSSVVYKVQPRIHKGEPLYLLSDLRQPEIMPSVSEGDGSEHDNQRPRKDFGKGPVFAFSSGGETLEGLPPPVSSFSKICFCFGAFLLISGFLHSQEKFRDRGFELGVFQIWIIMKKGIENI